MQILDGTLAVEVIKGNRGEFCVGTLTTSIGEFKVKDAALEQFERGTYAGRFSIEKVYIESTRWRGGWFTNLMAKIAIDGYQINEEDTSSTSTPNAQAEPDPIDEQTQSQAKVQPESVIPDDEKWLNEPKAAESLQNALEWTANNPVTDPEETLFGIELYPLFKARAPAIALDNTIDREQFRLQRDKLKASGYRFDPKDQQWHLGAKA